MNNADGQGKDTRTPQPKYDRIGRWLSGLSLLATVALGVAGFTWVQSVVNEFNNYRLEDNRSFTTIFNQLSDLEEAVDEAAGTTTTVQAQRAEFISGLAATDDSGRLNFENSFAYFDEDGNRQDFAHDVLVPIFEEESTTLCLWVDNEANPTHLVALDCTTVIEATSTSLRPEYPLYRGWWLEHDGDTTLNGDPRDDWRFCFSAVTDPATWSDFIDAAHCVAQANGTIPVDEPVTLVARTEVVEAWPNAVLDPIENGMAQIAFWGTDGAARCLSVQPGGAVSFTADCDDQGGNFSIGSAQYLIYRNHG